jgi:hypothetical protein
VSSISVGTVNLVGPGGTCAGRSGVSSRVGWRPPARARYTGYRFPAEITKRRPSHVGLRVRSRLPSLGSRDRYIRREPT